MEVIVYINMLKATQSNPLYR